MDRKSSHTTTRLTVHIVWVTKYRYHILKGDVQQRCRDILVQICDSDDVKILKGVISKDHVHLHLEYPPKLSVSDIVKRLKGHTSRKLQQEYPWIEALLGSPFLGKRLWSMEYRKYYR